MHNINELIKSPKGRLEIVKAITTKKYYDRDGSSHKGDYWQGNSTPMSIANKMVDKVDEVKNKSIFIMFNLEFLEALIYIKGVERQNITFLADNEVKQQMAENVYGVKTLLITKENHNVKGMKEIMANKKFDVIFSNPPYNANIDIKILKEVTPLAKELVIVHPSTWLIDMLGKSKLYNDFCSQVDGTLKSVELFNGNPIFNIQLFVPTMITHIDNSYNGVCDVDIFNDKFTSDNISNITKFGSQYGMMVKPFISKIYGVETLETTFSKDKEYKIQLATIRGHVNLTANSGEIVKDDFYTMIMKNPNDNKGMRNEIKRNDDNRLIFSFDTELEQEHFLSYMQTDFARFCLAINKVHSNQRAGCLNGIPYLDFTQEWNDEKLYEFFNIDEETQTYITNFLPDYHGIRGEK